MRARIVVPCLGLLLLVAGGAVAQDFHAHTRLRGFEEVPAIATPAGGRFEADIDSDAQTMEWTLEFARTEANVTQAHIHFAQAGVNGAIVIFLCSNLGNGPAGTQACPAAGGTVSGTIHASDVLAAAAQGVEAGNFGSVLRAMRAGRAYVNVHSALFPGGEIRGQLRVEEHDDERVAREEAQDF